MSNYAYQSLGIVNSIPLLTRVECNSWSSIWPYLLKSGARVQLFFRMCFSKPLDSIDFLPNIYSEINNTSISPWVSGFDHVPDCNYHHTKLKVLTKPSLTNVVQLWFLLHVTRLQFCWFVNPGKWFVFDIWHTHIWLISVVHSYH